MYALKVTRAHGMNDDTVHVVYSSVNVLPPNCTVGLCIQRLVGLH